MEPNKPRTDFSLLFTTVQTKIKTLERSAIAKGSQFFKQNLMQRWFFITPE
jgi:hypothetical protein